MQNKRYVMDLISQIEGGDGTALASVLDADVYLNDLLKEEKEINIKLGKSSITPEDSALLHSRLKVVYQELHNMDADKAEARYFILSELRASAILHGLGFSSEQQQAATSTFSGGWRMVFFFFTQDNSDLHQLVHSFVDRTYFQQMR